MFGVIRTDGKSNDTTQNNNNRNNNNSNSINFKTNKSKKGNQSEKEEYSALARVSIVNFDGKTVYDQFVKPKKYEKIVVTFCFCLHSLFFFFWIEVQFVYPCTNKFV